MSPLVETLQPSALTEREMECCAGCGHRISDRYIMRVGELSYHERCLVCHLCGASLHHTCFTRDSKLFCRHDYERVYVKKCLSCGEPIGPSELVMKAAVDSVFHLRCFLCVVCGVRLQKGDQYVVKQGQLFCRPDYEKEVEMFQGYAQGGENALEEGGGGPRSTDGRRGPKRPRTILTTQQRRAFKASFELSPKPCRKVRENLAKDTGLSVRIVQVWFQNQRAKIKKMQKKHRLDQKNNNNNGKELDLEEKNEKIKDDDHSSQGGGAGYLGDSCSDTEGLATDYSRVKEEREESVFYRNMLSEQQGTVVHQYLGHHDGGGGKCESSFPYPGGPGYDSYFLQHGLNPIDRLYSMQNSYFCGAEEGAMMEQ